MSEPIFEFTPVEGNDDGFYVRHVPSGETYPGVVDRAEIRQTLARTHPAAADALLDAINRAGIVLDLDDDTKEEAHDPGHQHDGAGEGAAGAAPDGAGQAGTDASARGAA